MSNIDSRGNPGEHAPADVAAPIYPPREPLNDVGRELLQDPQVRAILDTVVRDFPHVVNQISAAWQQPAQCTRLLGDLLLDDRLSRRGFPLTAILELSDLRAYYEDRVVPQLQSGLDSARRAAAARPAQKEDSLAQRLGSLFRR